MSLPPGFLDELRARTSLSQVAGRKVIWDTRKSNQGKGDMWAPCPFHQEKTASFHVDDREGFYYCFGCHAKGDAITFVRETENLGFMEAVEQLAREAGMEMPARDPAAQQKADRRTQLVEVMEQAVQFFRLQLKTAGAAEARDYLAGRGLSEAALERWEIGFAPPGWQNLADHMAAKGVDPEMLQAVGLTKPSDKGRAPYDVFRNRIMFPIRDGRGRAIAFGGRAMDPEDNAKYLNSPETELFDKGRNLFNHGPARQAAGKDQPLLVAEGYMDVIALSEAGFGAVVAPLGTAITEDQLRLLWRIAPEPIVALDGDKAGMRAALRAMDLAFPMLEAGQSLRFAMMPEGQDPDDLIRSGGPSAMQSRIEAAIPMITLLWQRETEGKVFDSPERRAALDKSLRESIRKIRDASIRSHYGQEVNRLRQALFRGERSGSNRRGTWQNRRNQPAPASASAKSSPLVAGSGLFEDELREAVILAILLHHPSLVDHLEGDLERLEMQNATNRDLLSQILASAHADEEKSDSGINPQHLEKLMSLRHVQLSPALRNPQDRTLAQSCLEEELTKLAVRRGAEREIAEAAQDLDALADEGVTWRLGQAAEARNKSMISARKDETEFQTADNGVRLDAQERSALDRALAEADPAKAGRKRP